MSSARFIPIICFTILLLLTKSVLAASPPTPPKNPCSFARTNVDCILTIDRKYPVSPPTIQMYSGSRLWVRVKDPLPFEKYFLDTMPGTAALIPDTFAAIFKGLSPSVPNLIVTQSQAYSDVMAPRTLEALTTSTLKKPKPKKPKPKPKPKPKQKDICGDPAIDAVTSLKHAIGSSQKVKEKTLQSAVASYDSCFQELLIRAGQAYTDIDPYLDPYLTTYAGVHSRFTAYKTLRAAIENYVVDESRLSTTTDSMAAKSSDSPPQIFEDVFEIINKQKLLKGIANDLFGYEVRFSELDRRLQDDLSKMTSKDNRLDSISCQILNNKSGPCTPPAPQHPAVNLHAPCDPQTYSGMAITSKTYTLNALNMVANQAESATVASTSKVSIASVTVQYAGAAPRHSLKYVCSKDSGSNQDSSSKQHGEALRWNASVGVLISTLPVRSFSATPVYSGTAVTDNTVHEITTRPTAVPFAGANYRITDHLPGARWQSGLYLTLGLGVNPNTKTADGAAGISLSWREFMVSFLFHFAHDVRLTQGFYKNESLGTGFSGTLPTETFWKTSFAIGFSIRTPGIPGR